MRVVAGTAEARKYRLVWHVPKCIALDHVFWVDSDTSEYCQFYIPIRLSPIHMEPDTYTTKCKKIELRPLLGTILIDPVEGLDEESITEELALEN